MGVFSQCQGSINSVSLGIEASSRECHIRILATHRRKMAVPVRQAKESTTRMLCKSQDLRKEEAVLFILAKQNLACTEQEYQVSK